MKALLSPVVLRNFGALLTLQAGTYLIPLLLVPYLIRVLGFDVFGKWMFAMAFVIIARICVSYGFDLTATRQVAAVAHSDQNRLSELLADVVTARLIIWAACFAFMMGLSCVIGQLAEIRTLIALAMFILLGEGLFPVWLFQGMETMGTITQLRLGAKLLNLLLVVALVKGPEDLILVPLLEAATMVGAGTMALMLARRRFSVQFVRPKPQRLKAQLRDGGPVFVSTLAVQFYTTANMIVLGFLVGPAAVGAYSLAEKVYSALRGLLGPFVQAIFPAMARLHDTARDNFSSNYRSVLKILLPTLFVVGVLLFVTAGPLVELASGEREGAAVMALQVFALAFPFALGSFLAPMLVVRGRSGALMRITILGGILGVLTAPVLSWFFGAPGAAGAFLMVQIYNTATMVWANRVQA